MEFKKEEMEIEHDEVAEMEDTVLDKMEEEK